MIGAVLRAATELQAFCTGRQWRFCVIGGLAVARWGQIRATVDVDVTLLTGFGSEEQYASQLLGHFQPRVPDALAFAVRHRVLLLKAADGTGIDVSFGGLPFEERAVARASVFELAAGVVLTTCCAEDLIVHKVFAGRGQDWVDVRSILVRQTGQLDLDLVREELNPLLDLKGTPEALERFEDLVREAST